MREILFRGKRTDNGEWVYGYPLIDNADRGLKADGKCVCPHDGSEAGMYVWEDNFHEYDWFDVRADTIGQYTGLTDKNGVKIFEGDIVSLYFWDGVTSEAVVKFGFHQNWNREDNQNYGWYLEWILKENDDGLDTKSNIAEWKDEISVIGNIHDNPDLLEGGTE